MKENDTKELSNYMFLNVITSSFLVIFPKLFGEELLGFSNNKVARLTESTPVVSWNAVVTFPRHRGQVDVTAERNVRSR